MFRPHLPLAASARMRVQRYVVRSGVSRLYAGCGIYYRRESLKLWSYATAFRSHLDAQRHIIEAEVD